MSTPNDIYDNDLIYERTKKRIITSTISSRNKELILNFEKTCSLDGLTKARKIKVLETLCLFAKHYLKKDYDKAGKEDLKDAILKLDSRNDLSPWTKQCYKAIVKKFYKWFAFGDDYNTKIENPEIISWLRAGIKEKDKPKVQASDILTEKEIEELLNAAEHPRDKAFISMLYELGARIGEIGNLKIKDITQDKYSYLIDLTGKTGHRTPRIVTSSLYLTNWLNSHPLKKDPTAPLWVMVGDRNKNKKMSYSTFRAVILRLKEKSRINKRIHSHLFRHTRVTHLLANKQINEAQAKVYFGWVPSSKMFSEYSHLVSQDVNELILEIHGIKTSKKEEEQKVIQCPRCKTVNPKDYLFCGKCSSVLDVRTAVELDEKRQDSDKFMTQLLADKDIKEMLVKKIIEKGIGKDLMKIFLAKEKD
jgi:integrase/recombinase XerD